MGEVLLVDEHRDNLTIIHRKDGAFYISHFAREIREGETWYTCIDITGGWGILIGPDFHAMETKQRTAHTLLRFGARTHERLDRKPIWGTSITEQVYDLTINGQTPDHIILLEELTEHPAWGDVPLYFWYIADFQADVNSPSDIVICFEEEE